jgi:hypothetical protein
VCLLDEEDREASNRETFKRKEEDSLVRQRFIAVTRFDPIVAFSVAKVTLKWRLSTLLA